MTFDFAAPWFLLCLLGVPVVILWTRRSMAGLSPLRRRTAITLRVAVMILLALALAELRILRQDDRLAVMFLLDRSESIPPEQREAARQYALEASRARNVRRDDLAGIVAFGKTAGIEVIPKPEALEVHSFNTLIETDATDLAAAVRLAAAAFPDGAGKRMVIISDGNENRGAVLEEVRAARSSGMVVDVVPITYAYPAEISVEKLLVDPEVNIGQPFDIRVVVDSTATTEAVLRLFENDVHLPLGDPKVKLRPGKNVFDFKGRRLEEAGRFSYEARLEPVRPEDDSIIQNNSGIGFTFIRGQPKVLLCAPEPELDGALLAALEAEKIGVHVVRPALLPGQIEEYFEYDAVILSNVASHQLSEDLMKLFDSLVKEVGLGFVMIGGEDSFGAGGYQGTPVERLLPVDMEIKQRKTLPRGALAMVVHSCELGNGNWWARQVIQRALRILSPRDYAGVLYHDDFGGEKWLFPMLPVSQRQRMISLLNGFNPGDMMSFQTIMSMALTGLQGTQASIKHMIILSDGDPAMPTAQQVQSIRDARITISAICYGAHGGVPTQMKQLAADGGGNFHYLQGPDNLPEIFIREVTTVQKSLIIEEPFRPVLVSRGAILQGVNQEDLPPLDGLVITTPKELATQLIVRPPGKEDPAEDPVLAVWTYGLGKSIAFTSDAGRRWGKSWASWEGFRRFWGQCLRWVSRSRGGEQFQVARNVDGDAATVAIDAVTPDGRLLNGLRFEGTVIGPDLEASPAGARQVAPGRYAVEFPVARRGTYTVVLNYEEDGERATYVTGVSVPYSPEYRRLSTNHDLLRQIAAAGGGEFLDPPPEPEEGGFFARDFPRTSDIADAWRILLTLAVALFYADVFVRRVVIDYWQTLKAGVGRAVAFVRRPDLRAAPADARLATLLERKADLRRRAVARVEARVPSRPAASGAAGTGGPSGWPEAASGAGAGQPAAAATAEESRAAEVAPAAPEPENTYTARLLAAKRRALGKEASEDKK